MIPIIATRLIICFIALTVIGCDGVSRFPSDAGKSAARHLETEIARIGQASNGASLSISKADKMLFTAIFDTIQQNYVTEIDSLALVSAAVEGVRRTVTEKRHNQDDTLGEVAITAMLASLDPYSTYLDQEAYRILNEDLNGQFGGIGIRVTMEAGRLTVVAPLDNTPGKRAGILTGDIITHANGVALEGMSLFEATSYLKGPVDTAVVLQIERSKDQVFRIEVYRDIIQTNSVKWRVQNDVGYIRITNFDTKTVPLLKQAMTAFSAQTDTRLRGIILDLRNNPGGALTAAVGVTDMFLQEGAVVNIRGRTAEQAYNADAGQMGEIYPMVVLINQGSASASEIVAGALHDNKRAVLMGEPSFGKGSVQTVFPLFKARGMKMTTAYYYTPLGKSVEGGIKPDITSKDDPTTELDETLDLALTKVIKMAGDSAVFWHSGTVTR